MTCAWLHVAANLWVLLLVHDTWIHRYIDRVVILIHVCHGAQDGTMMTAKVISLVFWFYHPEMLASIRLAVIYALWATSDTTPMQAIYLILFLAIIRATILFEKEVAFKSTYRAVPLVICPLCEGLIMLKGLFRLLGGGREHRRRKPCQSLSLSENWRWFLRRLSQLDLAPVTCKCADLLVWRMERMLLLLHSIISR